MRRLPRWIPILCFLAAPFLAAQAPSIADAELRPETLQRFTRYVTATETRINREATRPEGLLYIDGLSRERRSEVLEELKQGEIFIEPLKTRNGSRGGFEVRGGLIHHWLGDVFIPGASLRQVLDLVQDYSHHQDFYKPEIVRSRLIARDGNDYKIFYRLRKHKVITVTLNTEHDVRYTRVDDSHWYSRSVSTRIAEVVDAGKRDEHEKPVGRDGGFLWRINSYWRFVERDGGVYVECESISLTRDIPTGLGWLIGPFVTGIPRESLDSTLRTTRSAVLARVAAASKR